MTSAGYVIRLTIGSATSLLGLAVFCMGATGQVAVAQSSPTTTEATAFRMLPSTRCSSAIRLPTIRVKRNASSSRCE